MQKLDSYTRKSRNILFAYIMGKLSMKQFHARLQALDASEPYIVTEETWRRQDGLGFMITKIIERGTSKIISKTTKLIMPQSKAKHYAWYSKTSRLSKDVTVISEGIVQVETQKSVAGCIRTLTPKRAKRGEKQ